MKTKIMLLSAIVASFTIHAATTIDTVNRYAYGANIGWVTLLRVMDPRSANQSTAPGIVQGQRLAIRAPGQSAGRRRAGAALWRAAKAEGSVFVRLRRDRPAHSMTLRARPVALIMTVF